MIGFFEYIVAHPELVTLVITNVITLFTKSLPQWLKERKNEK